jgi:hypothetical protein
MRHARMVFAVLGLAIFALTLAGCYEELEESPPPQPQAQGSPSSGSANEGLIAPMQQRGSSALGKAKTAASNVVEQAEAQSQEVADQADEIVNNNDDDDDGQ